MKAVLPNYADEISKGWGVPQSSTDALLMLPGMLQWLANDFQRPLILLQSLADEICDRIEVLHCPANVLPNDSGLVQRPSDDFLAGFTALQRVADEWLKHA